jgi:hypothetical protein
MLRDGILLPFVYSEDYLMFRKLGWLTSCSGMGKRPGPPRVRPQLESLEDRVVPTTFTSLTGSFPNPTTLTIRETSPGTIVTVTENPNSSITVSTNDPSSSPPLPRTFNNVQNIVFLDQETTAGTVEVDFINHGGQALPGFVTVNGQVAGTYNLVVDFGATGGVTAAHPLVPAFNFNVKGAVVIGNIAAGSSLEVNVFNSSFGSASIQGGGNGTSVEFGNTMFPGHDTVRGAVSVNLGTGGDFNGGVFDVAEFVQDSIGGNLTVTGANGDEMLAELSTVHGSTSVNFTGNFSDVVELVEFTEVQDLNIITGNGTDEVIGEIVNVSGSTTINTHDSNTEIDGQPEVADDFVELLDLTELKNLSITTGNGDDQILLGTVEVDGTTTVNTGTATAGDTVDITDGTFQGAVTITFGTFNPGFTGRNDRLFIQSANAPLHDNGGSTAFYGVVTVNMGVCGTGSNTLDMADTANSGTVFFDAGALFSGGLGGGTHTATFTLFNVSGILPTSFVYFTVVVL